VIIFLEELGLAVPTDDHLIEIERDAKRPAEVGDEEEVDEDRHRDARALIARDR